MRLMPAICFGFGGALFTAILIGFGIGMAYPLPGGPPALYAADLAGIVICLAVFYFLARLLSKRQRRKDSVYGERLA